MLINTLAGIKWGYAFFENGLEIGNIILHLDAGQLNGAAGIMGRFGRRIFFVKNYSPQFFNQEFEPRIGSHSSSTLRLSNT
jgi:hypothetical protein